MYLNKDLSFPQLVINDLKSCYTWLATHKAVILVVPCFIWLCLPSISSQLTSRHWNKTNPRRRKEGHKKTSLILKMQYRSNLCYTSSSQHYMNILQQKIQLVTERKTTLNLLSIYNSIFASKIWMMDDEILVEFRMWKNSKFAFAQFHPTCVHSFYN